MRRAAPARAQVARRVGAACVPRCARRSERVPHRARRPCLCARASSSSPGARTGSRHRRRCARRGSALRSARRCVVAPFSNACGTPRITGAGPMRSRAHDSSLNQRPARAWVLWLIQPCIPFSTASAKTPSSAVPLFDDWPSPVGSPAERRGPKTSTRAGCARPVHTA